MRLYLPRFFVRDLQTNISAMHAACAAASTASCEAIMFPEQFLTGYRTPAEPAELHSEFIAASSRCPDMLCIFGSITEQGCNRQWVYRAGQPLAHYDKVHLFLPNGEGDLWQPGERYVAVRANGIRLGLATCNDVRFSEQARALKLRCGIELLTYPALWPWQRDHVWRSLLQARAIENGIFCAGCCVAGIDNGDERFDGAGNYVFDPLGNPVYAADCVYQLDLGLLNKVTVDTAGQYVEISRVELIEA